MISQERIARKRFAYKCVQIFLYPNLLPKLILIKFYFYDLKATKKFYYRTFPYVAIFYNFFASQFELRRSRLKQRLKIFCFSLFYTTTTADFMNKEIFFFQADLFRQKYYVITFDTKSIFLHKKILHTYKIHINKAKF